MNGKRLLNNVAFRTSSLVKLQVKGVEHALRQKIGESSEFAPIEFEYTPQFNIHREQDWRRYYDLLSNNDIVIDCIEIGTSFERLPGVMPYEEYCSIIRQILEDPKFSEDLAKYSDLSYWFQPIHTIRPSEVDVFYRYECNIVLNGVEFNYNAWEDGSIMNPYYQDACEDAFKQGKMPDYVAMDISKLEKLSGIPSEEIKIAEFDKPRDATFTMILVPKKYLEKVIMYRRYLDPVILEGHWGHKEYTGRYDRWVLDMNNPDPEVLEVMKKHYMCVETQNL